MALFVTCFLSFIPHVLYYPEIADRMNVVIEMIVMKELNKTFPDNVTAVNNVSLHIAPGEAVALIGANGAGKTTLIKLICGMCKPTSGYLRVFGEDPMKRGKNTPLTGLVSGAVITDSYSFHYGHSSSVLQDDMMLGLNLEMIGNIYRIPKKLVKQRTAEFAEAFGLKELMYYRIAQLSLGQRMKAELAAVLLFSPKLLMLDEPFVGVDATSRLAIGRALNDLVSKGDTTLILTTHSMIEAEQICKRIILLDGGKLAYNGSIDRLKRSRIGLNRIDASFEDTPPDLGDLPVTRYTAENYALSVEYDVSDIPSSDIAGYIIKNSKAKDIMIEKPAVEKIIRELYKEGQNGNDDKC